MKVEDRLKKAHVALSRDDIWCSYSALLACGDTIVSKSHGPTACTDGWTKWYNPDFVDKLTDAELRLLVLHENTHVAYQHLKVWKDLSNINPRKANIAMDHFVNLSLMDSDKGRDFIAMPKDGVQPDPQYRGLNVKQIFDLLPDEEKDGGKGEGGSEGGGGGNESGGGGDPNDGGMDSHDWNGPGKVTEDEQQSRAKEISDAIRQGEAVKRTRGKGTGGADGVFGDLLNPKVDWRKLLREFVIAHCAGKQESTWRKPNRRYLADDIYMPSMIGTKLDTLLIGFDTSGSCFGSADMTLFVSELTSVVAQVSPSMLHVVYCDYDVTGHQEFRDGQFAVQNLKPVGGGGTDLTNIFSYAEAKNIKPTAAIIFTDGYTPFGKAASYPTLWAINTDVVAPWGTTVKID